MGTAWAGVVFDSEDWEEGEDREEGEATHGRREVAKGWEKERERKSEIEDRSVDGEARFMEPSVECEGNEDQGG